MQSVQPLELEGRWEEILAHSEQLAGRKVQVKVLPEEAEVEPSQEEEVPFSSARSLLKYAGSWLGDDIEERLQEAHDNRGKAKF